MTLGHTIKVYRALRGFSQKEVAEHCNVTPSYLSLVESDDKEPSLGVLRALAEKLGTTVGSLVDTELTRRAASILALHETSDEDSY